MGFFDFLTGGNVPTQYQDAGYIKGQVQQGIRGAQQQAAPTVDNDSLLRADQLHQINMLQQIASGQQKGAGELAAERQTQNAAAQQQAMARMARGGDSALAFRNAADNTGAIGLSGAGMAKEAALQDQANAMGQLGNALQATRGQDFNVSNANAGLAQNQFIANNNAVQNYLSQLGNMDANQLTAADKAAMSQNQFWQGLTGAGLNGLGGILATKIHSDKNLKEDIEPADQDIDDLLDNLAAYNYRYKDDKYGKGKRSGIMAQDLEKSKMGKEIVIDLPEGKALDTGKALSAALASLARLNQRTRELEKKSA